MRPPFRGEVLLKGGQLLLTDAVWGELHGEFSVQALIQSLRALNLGAVIVPVGRADRMLTREDVEESWRQMRGIDRVTTVVR